MPYDLDRVKDVSEEGQNIHGLYIEGGKWNRQEGKLDESEPKKLFLPIPVIYITGITLSLRRSKGVDYGQYGPYDCAIYKYPKRNDRYLIFRMLLKTEQHPFHWKLRGPHGPDRVKPCCQEHKRLRPQETHRGGYSHW